MSSRINRRAFLRTAAISSAAAMIAACGATPTPAPTQTPVKVEVTKVVEKPVTQIVEKPVTQIVEKQVTQIVEKPVTKIVEKVVTATPAPAATTAPATTLKSGGTLRMASTFPSASLINMISSPNRPYYFLLHELLVTLNTDTGQLIPRLADKWEWSGDGKTLTIKVRENAKFHDGKPVTAKDVVFSWSVCADPRTGSNYSGLFANIAGAAETKAGTAALLSGMKAVDEKTVQVTLAQRDPLFLEKMAQSNAPQIWPSHLLENEPREKFRESGFWLQQVGTGPFKWAKYTKDQRIEYERFDDYYGGKPLLDRINCDIITNANTQIAAFEKGDYDLIFAIPVAEAMRLSKMAGVKVLSTWRGRAESVVLNHTASVKEIADPRFKRALMYAIDRETIADTVYANRLGGRPCYSNFMDPWAMSPKPNPFKYDPQAAKALLADMKWNASQEVILTSGDNRMPLATVLQQYFAAVGIKVTVRAVDEPTEKDLMAKNQLQLNMSAEGAALIPETMANTTTCKMAPPAGRNDSRYCNAKADALWEQIVANTDMSKRQGLFQQLDEIFREDPVWIPVVEAAQPWIFKDPFVISSDNTFWMTWPQAHKWGFRS